MDEDVSPMAEPTAFVHEPSPNAASVPTSATPSIYQLPPSDQSSDKISPSATPDSLTPLRPVYARNNTSDGTENRRTSVQFLPQFRAENTERSRSRNPLRDSTSRRMSSPPAPRSGRSCPEPSTLPLPSLQDGANLFKTKTTDAFLPSSTFKPRVSFDTFDNRDAADFSLTLSRKHKDYAYSKRSRTFLCGTDTNEHSDTALEWLLDELVDDGDEIVCLRVVEKDSKEAREWAGQIPGRESREKGYRAEAQRMLAHIQEKNTESRAINIILEFAIGKVHETIQHMIRIYEPAMLVVGTRGRSLSGFHGLMPGSVSKYCLQHSPVPVIVVRPLSKRDKKKRKRMQDPTRRGYRDILDKSEDVAEGGHILDERNRRSIVGPDALVDTAFHNPEEEARMVAEAIGYKSGLGAGATDGSPLTRVISGRSERSTRSARSGSVGSYGSSLEGDSDLRSPKNVLMKSPELRDLDSPLGSDYEDSEDEKDSEQVPGYILAQEEALMRARERAIKTEEEERQLELERIEKENQKLNKSKKGKVDEVDHSGGVGALAALNALGGGKK
ncbi:hypothetical protein MBLNU457_4946t2 [Dothideomycetes sp. NU457]